MEAETKDQNENENDDNFQKDKNILGKGEADWQTATPQHLPDNSFGQATFYQPVPSSYGVKLVRLQIFDT